MDPEKHVEKEKVDLGARASEVETIDISQESRELRVFGRGSLKELDEHHRINAHWFRERIIIILSTIIILFIAIVATVEVFSDDTSSQDWGRQILATLLGFAAGAIWQADKRK